MERTIEEIKNRMNIVDVIGQVVSLKKAGVNYKGLCPFHSEKTPSFVVSDQKQIFTCFGCGESGDVITFTQKYYNLDFMEAVEKLAAQCGVEVKRTGRNDEKRDELYEINREAAKYFYKMLRAGQNPGMDYAIKRGLTSETLRTFGIGYASGNWQGLYDYLKSKGYEEDKMLKLGLISHSKGKYYDKFRNRLMFPIQNTRGKIIGFGGRIIGDGNPKYLNSQETPIFSKKNNLYGLYQSKSYIGKEDKVIVVEGYMDAISLYGADIKNVVASLGTALTDNQAKLIKRYTRNAILSYDSDDAGVKAAMRGLDVLCDQGIKVRVLHVTEGKDPDDFVKKKGKAAFLRLTDDALPFADYKIAFYKKRHDLSDVEQRAAFMQEAVSVLLKLGPVEADMHIKMLSDEYNISEQAIRAEMKAQSLGKSKSPPPRQDEKKAVQISAVEKNIIKAVLTDSKFMAQSDIIKEILKSESAKQIYNAICEVYKEGDPIPVNDVVDLLPDRERAVLADIIENVLLAGNEDKVFADCIGKAGIASLKRKEKRIIDMMSLADERENAKEMEKLTKELMQVQEMIQFGRKGKKV